MAHSDAWPGYPQAIVIDSLGSPGTAFGEGLTPLSPDELHDVRASGLTAVNLTVNGSPGSYTHDYDETIRQIAYWNAEIAAHPNVFLQVLRAVDNHGARGALDRNSGDASDKLLRRSECCASSQNRAKCKRAKPNYCNRLGGALN
jgi:hypothetical protein